MKWDGIFKETFYISSIHFSTKILGFLEKLLIAYIFGASGISDAYFFSFSVFIIIFDFFNETTSPALLPEYVKTFSKWDKKKLFNSAFSYMIAIGFTLSLLIFSFAPWIINTFSKFPDNTSVLSITYLRIISIGIGFVITSISTYLFINSDQKFLPASLGDLMFKITGSIFILYILIEKKVGLTPLAIGTAVGSLLKIGTHFIYLKKRNLTPSISFNSSIKKVFKLSSPMIAGVFFSKFRILFDNYLVSGMAIGSITALQYGYRVMEFGIVVLLEPFTTVIFPELVNLTKNTHLFIERISSSLKLLLTIFLPVSILSFYFRTDIITALFGRGAFEQTDILITSSAFSYYALSMSFICMDFLLSRSLFALGDTSFPPFFEIVSIVFHVIFAISFKYYGIHIISLAFFLNRVIKSTLLYIRFRFKTGFHLKTGYYIPKIIIFLVFNTFLINILKNFTIFFHNGRLVRFLIFSITFMVLYIIELYFSGITKEISAMFKSDK